MKFSSQTLVEILGASICLKFEALYQRKMHALAHTTVP